jgi:hypothetical protein
MRSVTYLISLGEDDLQGGVHPGEDLVASNKVGIVHHADVGRRHRCPRRQDAEHCIGPPPGPTAPPPSSALDLARNKHRCELRPQPVPPSHMLLPQLHPRVHGAKHEDLIPLHANKRQTLLNKGIGEVGTAD